MDLLPSQDQADIAASVADFLRREAPVEDIRKHRPETDTTAIWHQLAELGAFALAIDEAAGGLGLGLCEQIVVFRELGRALTPGPLLGSVLAAHVAAEAGEAELTARITAGAVRVALAEALPSGLRVFDAPGSEFTLVLKPDSAAVVSTDQLDLKAKSSMDPTVAIAFGSAAGVSQLAAVSSTAPWWRGCALTAALQTGIAEATRDASAEYAKLRQQYGKPIGAFQAVKHRCADMARRAESAWFQTVYATLAWDGNDRAGAFHLSAARVVATDAARANAADNIVNHGAMGFSEESEAHLFARRSLILETTVGTDRWHLESVATSTPDW